MTDPSRAAFEPSSDTGHQIVLVARHPFLLPTCSCGWVGRARRSRPGARQEGQDHLAAATGASLAG